MENKEKQVRKIAQRVMTKYKLHPPVDMMGLIQEKGITCVEENLGTNADGYTFKDMMNMMFGMICVFVKKSLILEIIKYVIMSFQNVHQWNKLKLHLVQRKM